MKKIIVTLLLLASACTQAKVTFDFWNRTNEPLYFELGTEQFPPTGANLEELTAFDPASKGVISRLTRAVQHGTEQQLGIKLIGDFAQIEDLDIRRKNLILLSRTKNLKPGDQAVLVTVNPNKDIYLVIDENQKEGIQLFSGDNRKYLIREQIGPQITKWIGKDITERGLSRANIAKRADIKIDPQYVISSKPAERPLSEQEKQLLEAAQGTDVNLSPEQLKAIETMKGLGISSDEDED